MIALNIPMPEKCGKCPCFHAAYPMHCQAVKADPNKDIIAPYGMPRPKWCPLVEAPTVPPVECVEYYDEVLKEWGEKCGNCGGIMYGEPCYCPHCGTEVKR